MRKLSNLFQIPLKRAPFILFSIFASYVRITKNTVLRGYYEEGYYKEVFSVVFDNKSYFDSIKINDFST